MEKLLRFSIFLFAIAFVGLSVLCKYTDSELWSALLGYWLPEEILKPWVYSRPLFYSLLWLFEIFPNEHTLNISILRILFSFISLGSLYFLFEIVKTLSQNRLVAFASVAFVLLNTGFLNQAFQIRSDVLVSFLFISVLHRLIANPHLYGGYFLLPMLASPKGVIWSTILLVFSLRLGRRVHWAYFLIPILLFLALLNPWIYFLQSFSAKAGGISYLSLESFSHLLSQWSRNPIFWILTAASLIGLHSTTVQNQMQKALGISCYLAMAILILYPEKTPFFILPFLFLFSINMSFLLQEISRSKSWFKYSLGIGASTILIATAIVWLNKNFKENNNSGQLIAIRKIEEALISEKILNHFDIVGLNPFYNSRRLFAGPFDEIGNEGSSYEIRKNSPESIFWVPKMRLLGTEFHRHLLNFYRQVGKDLYIYEGPKLCQIPIVFNTLLQNMQIRGPGPSFSASEAGENWEIPGGALFSYDPRW